VLGTYQVNSPDSITKLTKVAITHGHDRVHPFVAGRLIVAQVTLDVGLGEVPNQGC
jgi:hypothetical protein